MITNGGFMVNEYDTTSTKTTLNKSTLLISAKEKDILFLMARTTYTITLRNCDGSHHEMGKRNHLVTGDEDNTALLIHQATINNHYLIAKNQPLVLSIQVKLLLPTDPGSPPENGNGT